MHKKLYCAIILSVRKRGKNQMENTTRKATSGAKATLLLLVLMTIALACLTSCSKYSSHYSALMLVQSNTPQAASVSFSGFEGRLVLKMKSKADSAERMNFDVSLGEGNLTVSVDCAGVNAELLNLKGGDSYAYHLDNIGVGTVYVIIDSDGKCNDGRLSFTLE